MDKPSRPPFYLLTGLIIGLAVGLAAAWLWTPVDSLGTRPANLRSDFKDAYRELIARAYVANSDLGRAEARLALLEDDEPSRALAVQAQLLLGEGGSEDAARALGILAAHLENGPQSTPLALANPVATLPPSTPNKSPVPTNTPSDTHRPTATITPTLDPASSTSIPPTGAPPPSPTPTATATQGPPFQLLDISLVCEPNLDPPLIMINIFDGSGNPVPGVAAVITWGDNQQNRFITGMKPEYTLGYADFAMDPAVTYTLRLEDGGEPITGLTGNECEGGFWGSWRLNFFQP